MAYSLARTHIARVTTNADPLQDQAERVYSVCFQGGESMAPDVQLLEASNDQAASALAAAIRPWTRREIWDRHRLVRVLPATIATHRAG